MNRTQKLITGAAGALALIAATAFAAAPDGAFGPCGGPGGGPTGYGPMGMMYGGAGPGAYRGMGGPDGRIGMWGGGLGFLSEQHLADLKNELAITPQQEPAWKAFATKVAEQVGQMQALHAQRWQAAGGDTTVPERMSSNVAWMTQRLAGMQAVTTALADLYAVLSPEQRTIADQSFVAMGPRGYGRGPGPQVR